MRMRQKNGGTLVLTILMRGGGTSARKGGSGSTFALTGLGENGSAAEEVDGKKECMAPLSSDRREGGGRPE